jgi:hypothetical protein
MQAHALDMKSGKKLIDDTEVLAYVERNHFVKKVCAMSDMYVLPVGWSCCAS